MHTTLETLNTLFAPDDRVYTCGPVVIGTGPTEPRVWAMHTPALLSSHVFFCINPLSPGQNRNIKKDGTPGSRRHALNVSDYRNFIFESDVLSVEQQAELIPVLNKIIPIKLATFSGSKSIHLIVSIVDTLGLEPHKEQSVDAYKRMWSALAQTLDAEIKKAYPTTDIRPRSGLYYLDPATCDPARLSRIPGAMRDGVEQRILFEGGYTTAEFIMGLAASAAPTMPRPTQADQDGSMTVSEFEKILKKKLSLLGLKTFFEEPQNWASSSGLYGVLFKHAMWAIDATGVPYPTLNAYLKTKVYPAIFNAGYPRDPDRAVRDAYVKKGLL